VAPAGEESLLAIKKLFRPLQVEIIGRPAAKRFAETHPCNLTKSIIAVLRRRPSTIKDLCESLGADAASVEKAVASMREEGVIVVEKLGRGEFYRIP
jgi:DNA-binding MarR family transcriptional regulator